LRVIFSRKGFDSGSGGTPSPIVDGRPISLPIPAHGRSLTSYDQIGLGNLVERATNGKIDRHHLCHHDPLFFEGECFFGQCGAAQSHLRNQGVTTGDVFLFFGLFADERTGEKHHRIFGYLKVEDIIPLATVAGDSLELPAFPRPHPHTIGSWNANNTLYRGTGAGSQSAPDSLRLTQPGGPLSQWIVPAWLQATGLSYHGAPKRWLREGRLQSVARGQEFVTDIGSRQEPRLWLDQIIKAIEA
jgi:Nucleotide modification associated domain 3